MNSLIGQYVKAEGVVGVIFSASSSVVKIMSIDEASKSWGYYGTSTGATSTTDGASNTDKIASASSAAQWCRAKGAAWYLPAKTELSTIYILKAKLNNTLLSINGTQLGTVYYWSSTESSNDGAYSVDFGNGNVSSYLRNNSNEVRAVRAL